MNYIRPVEETTKVRGVNLSTNLAFQSRSIVLESGYGNNFNEIGRIDSLLTAILNDPTIVLNSVGITGYSSPEGLYQANETLSKERAQSVKNYLTTKYPLIAQDKYQVGFGGENWDGLYDMVINSDTPA